MESCLLSVASVPYFLSDHLLTFPGYLLDVQVQIFVSLALYLSCVWSPGRSRQSKMLLTVQHNKLQARQAKKLIFFEHFLPDGQFIIVISCNGHYNSSM